MDGAPKLSMHAYFHVSICLRIRIQRTKYIHAHRSRGARRTIIYYYILLTYYYIAPRREPAQSQCVPREGVGWGGGGGTCPRVTLCGACACKMCACGRACGMGSPSPSLVPSLCLPASLSPSACLPACLPACLQSGVRTHRPGTRADTARTRNRHGIVTAQSRRGHAPHGGS